MLGCKAACSISMLELLPTFSMDSYHATLCDLDGSLQMLFADVCTLQAQLDAVKAPEKGAAAKKARQVIFIYMHANLCCRHKAVDYM